MNLFKGCVGKTLENDLKWLNQPQNWLFDPRGLVIVPDPRTDFFRPFDGDAFDNACFLCREIHGDFTAETRITVKLKEFADAAAITVRAGELQWAKLCLEMSPTGEMNTVSVVTDRWSDDATGELVSVPECRLRLTRKGRIFGMHYSLDGLYWRFVRAFTLQVPEEVHVGVHAQAPHGSGCEAVFHSLELTDHPIEDFRSGK